MYSAYAIPGSSPSWAPSSHPQTLQQHVAHQPAEVPALQEHPSLPRPSSQSQMHPHVSSYGVVPALYDYVQPGRKRTRTNEGLHLDLQNLPGSSGTPPGAASIHITPHSFQAQPHLFYQVPTQMPRQTPQHHHHRLPNSQPPTKMRRLEYGTQDIDPSHQSHGPPSVVGQEGMPQPAPRPRGPKIKFTPEDDQLLVDLKEKKNLTWKQIADFFPGRSSGTLQVRYCTKLKAKTTNWTDDMVSSLGSFPPTSPLSNMLLPPPTFPSTAS